MRNLSCVLVLALAACSPAKSSAVSGEEAKQLLLDRNWLDRMPQTEREKLLVYRFVPSMGGGVFQDRTLYKGTFELFRFAVTDDVIRFDLPETHQKIASSYRIEVVDGPPPFDLRLTIDADPRGTKYYYGIRAETDRTGELLEQRLAATRADGE
jgi:hypothetical protein